MCRLISLMVVLTWSGTIQAAVLPGVMELFITTEQRDAVRGVDTMKNAGIRVLIHIVDDLHRAEAELSARLPHGVEAAKAAAGDVIRSMTPEDERRFVAAWFALQRAHRFSIHQAPAVVFDSSAVVFGVIQLEQALSLWREVNK